MDPKRSYWRSVLSVFGGAAVAQTIPMIGALVIARQYGPKVFGSFSTWLGIVLIFSTLFTMRLEMALALEVDGRQRNLAAYAVFYLSIIIMIVVAPFSVLAILWGEHVPIFHDSIIAMCSIPGAALVAINQLWQSWASTDGNFRALNAIRICQALAVVSFQVTAGFIWQGPLALVLSYLVALLLTQFFCMRFLPLPFFWNRRTLRLVAAFFKRHRRFPIFSLPADFINVVTSQLPVLIIGSRFGAESAGYLAMSIRVLGAPLSFLGKAILDVFRRHASVAYRERGSCCDEYAKTFKVLTLGSIAFGVASYFFLERLFVLGFGTEWLRAGTVSVLLLPMFVLKFVASPLSYVLYIANKQTVDLLWQISLLIISYLALTFNSTENGAISTYAISYAALYVIYIGLSYRYSKGVK